MLQDITVKDLAIIQDVSVSFQEGLNVLTGETGAGKSIIVGAIGLVLGDRASAEMIRAGCDAAVIEAVFDLTQSPGVKEALASQGVEVDQEMVVRRIISRSGASRVFLNGARVPLSTLRSQGEALVNIYGQHESQGLLRPETHLEILDAYGGLKADRERMAEAFKKAVGLLGRLEKTRRSEAEKASREDYLRFQVSELEKADIRQGELEELETRRRKLKGAEQLAEAARSVLEASYESEDSLIERLATLARQAGRVEALDPEFGAIPQQLEQASISLQELAHFCRGYLADLEHDPAAFETVEDRIHAIKTLLRKYGPDEQSALDRLDEAHEELARFENLSGELERLESQVQKAVEDLLQRGLKLETKRRAAAKRMAGEIESELGELSIRGARFSVSLAPLEGAGIEVGDRWIDATGGNRVEFLLSANPGEPVRPLAKIASGGELSRILLALKNALARHFWVPTLVFDEVDVGISGRQAETIGQKLMAIAADHQVLCITHLPQIAAKADHHFLVHKAVKSGRTTTRVEKLVDKKRIEETARLLAGKKVTDAARAAAVELLDR